MSSVVVAGDTSGSITISAPAVSGSSVLTLPAVTDTLVGLAATQTLTNKSIVATQLTGTVAVANGGTGVTASKQLIQNLNTTTGAYATGTTTIPADNTIPQITEGDQYMTLAITPTSATSVLEITVVSNYGSGAAANGVTALFKDADVNALAVMFGRIPAANNQTNSSFIYRATSGTTSSITFRVRIGTDDTSATQFNGFNGTARYGGVLASSITIKEYTA